MGKRTAREQVLGPLGVGELDEAAYRALLGAPGASVSDLAAKTGESRDKVRAALARLQDEGLVTRAGDKGRGYVAMPPNVVIESLAARRRDEIERARLAAARLTSEMTEGPGGITGIVTVIEGREAMRLHCRQLQESATEEVLGFERPPYASPVQDLAASKPGRDTGVTRRFIYEPSAFEIDGYLDLVRSDIAAGEQARVYPELPVWMLIADRSTALVPLDVAKQAAGGAVLIHSSWLLDALITLFEALWSQAVPLPAEGDAWETKESDGLRFSDTDRQIITMMAAGTQDAAIARQLGVDPSTVRRRIAKMTKDLGAKTRFQAGIQAARRGLL